MTQEHPITPPPELVQQWATDGHHQDYCTRTEYIATQAARWGADQELEACCEWIYKLMDRGLEWSMDLRTARRPKPPSHKELALIALTALEACAAQSSDTTESAFYIRRALESLPS